MLNKNISALLSALIVCAISTACAPALAQDSSGFSTQYLAQNDQSDSEVEQSLSEDSGQSEETDQQSESSEITEGNAEPSADLSSFLPGGGGGGGRVSLATLFVQAIGLGILIVFVVAIPISFSCVMCALIWKIGMVARGGKKPNIG